MSNLSKYNVDIKLPVLLVYTKSCKNQSLPRCIWKRRDQGPRYVMHTHLIKQPHKKKFSNSNQTNKTMNTISQKGLFSHKHSSSSICSRFAGPKLSFAGFGIAGKTHKCITESEYNPFANDSCSSFRQGSRNISFANYVDWWALNGLQVVSIS